MRIFVSTIFSFIWLLSLSAQEPSQKVAVFSSVDNKNTGYAPIFREVLIEKLAKSNRYKPVERDLIDQVLKENEYQQTGLVDDTKIKEIGKQLGADYVCISTINKLGDNYFLSAKLVDILTTLIEKQENILTENGDKDLYEKMEQVAGKLLQSKEAINRAIQEKSDEFTDPRDGMTYKTIQINGLTWMAQNLNYDIGEGSFHYNNDPRNGERFGRLYTFEAALIACPSGWRLPLEKEWRELAKLYGGANDDASDGGKAALKALMAGGESGFNALFAGFKHKDGAENFKNFGTYGYFWTATGRDASEAWRYSFDGRGLKLIRGYTAMGYAYSCRCVKEE